MPGERSRCESPRPGQEQRGGSWERPLQQQGRRVCIAAACSWHGIQAQPERQDFSPDKNMGEGAETQAEPSEENGSVSPNAGCCWHLEVSCQTPASVGTSIQVFRGVLLADGTNIKTPPSGG
jgi:hypothetical protein